MHDIAVDFFHSAENDRAGELILVFSVYALLADPIRNVKLNLLQFVFALKLRKLEFTLVEDF